MRYFFGFIALCFSAAAMAEQNFFEANYGVLNGNTGSIVDNSANAYGAGGRFQITPEFDLSAEFDMIDLTGKGRESSKLKSELGYNYQLNEAAALRFSGGMARTRLDDTNSTVNDLSETSAIAGVAGVYSINRALNAEAGMSFSGGDTLGSTDYFVGGTYRISNNTSGLLRYENSSANESRGIDTDGFSFGVRMNLK